MASGSVTAGAWPRPPGEVEVSRGVSGVGIAVASERYVMIVSDKCMVIAEG
jgi:hypothetical protein